MKGNLCLTEHVSTGFFQLLGRSPKQSPNAPMSSQPSRWFSCHLFARSSQQKTKDFIIVVDGIFGIHTKKAQKKLSVLRWFLQTIGDSFGHIMFLPRKPAVFQAICSLCIWKPVLKRFFTFDARLSSPSDWEALLDFLHQQENLPRTAATLQGNWGQEGKRALQSYLKKTLGAIFGGLLDDFFSGSDERSQGWCIFQPKTGA